MAHCGRRGPPRQTLALDRPSLPTFVSEYCFAVRAPQVVADGAQGLHGSAPAHGQSSPRSSRAIWRGSRRRARDGHAAPSPRSAPASKLSAACCKPGPTPPKATRARFVPPRRRSYDASARRSALQDRPVEAASRACGDIRLCRRTRLTSASSLSSRRSGSAPPPPTSVPSASPCSAAPLLPSFVVLARGAIYARQRLSIREHLRRGNAPSHPDCRATARRDSGISGVRRAEFGGAVVVFDLPEAADAALVDRAEVVLPMGIVVVGEGVEGADLREQRLAPL